MTRVMLNSALKSHLKIFSNRKLILNGKDFKNFTVFAVLSIK